MEKIKTILHNRRNSRQATPNGQLNGLKNWAVAFVVCNFNVDVGPEIELVYPPGVPFATADLTAICFNSFPERQDTDVMEDLLFHFTISNNSPDLSLSSPRPPFGSAHFLYGACIFRQEFDHTTKRRFNQKTLVIISHHEFPAFFLLLLRQMTTEGNICDPIALEAACSQIAAWPAPSLGKQELPFIGSVLGLEVPPHAAFPLQGLYPSVGALSESKTIPVYAYEPLGSWNILVHYLSSLSDLYTLFEKLLLCESVVILGKSPQVCSQIVSALVDLIRPIPYAGDCRPYMTMQSDFRSLGIDGSSISRPFIIGITNPFLLKRVVSSVEAKDRAKPHVLYVNDPDSSAPPKRHHSRHHHNPRSPNGIDIPGGLDTLPSSRRYFKSDRAFLQTLDSAIRDGGPNVEVGALIRRHFAELAAQYLAPLNRYLASSVSASMSPTSGSPRYANFSEADFLQSLAKHGSSVKFIGQGPIQRHKARDAVYETFCRSPNFYSWLDMKLSLEKEASAGLHHTGPPPAAGTA